ncbi:MAG: IS3 family transposase, partial [Chloroflexota bacterium]|nr:IS3 family transposase [Chloroflexota bacterium]
MITAGSVLNGRYRLDALVGQGGFATVFRGTDLLLRRRVAVKVLKPEVVAEDPQALPAFDEEARRVADLEHPNILLVYDYGRVEDTAFLVLPYVDGGTLADRLRRARTLDFDEAGAYLRQAAAALDCAHAKGLVHRDVKPQTMLLRDGGRHLLVADFGIARVLSATSSKTISRGAGTIAYMPPEQFRGETSRAGDVYALGCGLFQMLTGDITYVPTWEGWLYLAVLVDADSRRVVGWAMADHLRAALAADALAMALASRRPGPGLVHHPDRGCQYPAASDQAILAGHGIAAALRRAGDCYDKAMAERFFATLKTELVDARPWPSRAAARTAIFEWIEVFYNRQRRHSALGYHSP